jgi:Tfp pilus assembly protein PilX
MKKLNTKSGQAVIVSVTLISLVFLIIVSGFSSVVLKEAKISRNLIDSKKSYFLVEAGIEDIAYRIMSGKDYDSEEVLNLDGFFATTTVSATGNDKEIISLSNFSGAVRKIKTVLSTDVGTSFHYGVQVGNGGFLMQNTSQIIGNIYSNGNVIGENSNSVSASVVSAGPSGLVDGISADEDVYAHTIDDSEVGGNAFYQNISDTSVAGTLYPNSPEQPSLPMPISDSVIEEWENTAEENIIDCSGTYTIDSNTTIGPVKITCDLKIKNNPVVTVASPVWVTGNVTFENSPTIKTSASLGDKSVALIADKQTDRLTSGKINMNQQANFEAGTPGSYLLLVSMNNSSENGGSEIAISSEQGAAGNVLLYAPHGQARLSQSASLKEITAYKVVLRNSATVTYESGLSDLVFTSGPSGGYTVKEWKETQ